MSILMPEGREWDTPVQMADDPFTYWLDQETSLCKLRDLGMPEEGIREIRQDTDAQLIDWHEGLMRVAKITGKSDPKLFGWGDIDYYSATTEEDMVPPITQAQQKLAEAQEQLAKSRQDLAKALKAARISAFLLGASLALNFAFTILHSVKHW